MKAFLLLACVGVHSVLASVPRMVLYWGQNGYGARDPDQSKWEKDLATTCKENPQYDALVLSFAISFVRTRNADSNLPELNFAFHCDTPYDAQNPFLLKCDQMAEGIKTCQSLGKKVLLSLGGAAGSYGFISDAEAQKFAQTAWDVFLGGSSQYRPFGNVSLDGVDLDIEGGSATGYGAFVKALRSIVDSNEKGRYFISGAPQCVFPDAYLGPGTGKALTEAASSFDYLSVQFYNNYCAYTNPSMFQSSWNQWQSLHGSSGVKILVGLPASSLAAGSGFIDRNQLPTLLNVVKRSPAFGGIMLWDVSYDQNNVQGGQKFSAYAKSLIGNAELE
jgi:chitinase